MDLIVTKGIGLEAAAVLAEDKETELAKRFPPSLLRTAKAFKELLTTTAEESLLPDDETARAVSLTGTGILSALWELAEAEGMGMEVDLRKIPIRQEVVEICEYYDVNPYYARSGGALLIAMEHGDEYIRRLAKVQISAAKIGILLPGNDRILWNVGNKRYLDRPQTEELTKLYQIERGELT